MKFLCDRATLARALGQVARIVEKRNSIPILAHCRIEAEAGAIRISGTDLDVEACATLPAEVAAPGAVALPAHMLSDIMAKLPDGRVTLEHAGEGPVLIACGRAKFKVAWLPAEDLPSLSLEPEAHRFTLQVPDLKALCADVAFAMSADETRYYLNGIFWHQDEATLVAVATDGHRLARTFRPLPAGADGMPAIILPRKAADALVRLYGGTTQALAVTVSPSKIRVASADLVFTSKLVDGTYPDYQRVIPRDNAIRVKVDRDEVAAAADRVKTVTSERGSAIRLEFNDGELRLSVINPDAGEASEVIPATLAGADITIGFNGKYLGEAIEAVGGEMLDLALADSGSPTLLSSPGREDFLVVLMPMRI